MYFGLSNKNSLHYLKFGIPTSQFLGLPLRTTHPKGTPTFPLTTPMESDAEEEAAATPAAVAGPAAGRLKGSPELTVDADMQEMAKAAAWSVSSCKAGNGVAALRDDNLDTYWQSDGAQPHLVNIQFQKKVQLQLVVLYVDFKLDESYTPSKISIRAGDGFHNLKEVKTVELAKPVGWVHISLSGADPRETFIHTFMLQIAILSNHLNGRDTHIRQIKIYGPRPEFITYSTIR
ncbi:anaphase-promoting complex subunit 10-like isoform X2 [Panicum virgatum]|nr:anaphase-promoting complex subunit 10-like isoform X2 [Panicum virgatum]